MTIGHRKFPISFNKNCWCPSKKGKKLKNEEMKTSKYVDIDHLTEDDSLPLLTDESS